MRRISVENNLEVVVALGGQKSSQAEGRRFESGIPLENCGVLTAAWGCILVGSLLFSGGVHTRVHTFARWRRLAEGYNLAKTLALQRMPPSKDTSSKLTLIATPAASDNPPERPVIHAPDAPPSTRGEASPPVSEGPEITGAPVVVPDLHRRLHRRRRTIPTGDVPGASSPCASSLRSSPAATLALAWARGRHV
jgi:hypothetical protein